MFYAFESVIFIFKGCHLIAAILVRLRLPVAQESTKSLKTLLVLHAKRFEMTKPSTLQVIVLK